MNKFIFLSFTAFIVSLIALIVIFNPINMDSEPMRIYFYDANGNPDGWGEVR